MRQGYTLLELLIVVSVLAIASVNLVTSFGQSQDRIEFQQKVNEISSTISAARSSSVSNDSGVDNQRVSLLNLGAGDITSYVENDETAKFTEGDDLIKKAELEGLAEVQAVMVLKKIEDGDEFVSKCQRIDTSVVRFFFYPESNTCDFSVSEDATLDPNDLMVSLYINRPEQSATRFLYFHKKSCLPELLSTPPC
jgi:prepilin-type N-terminal cleavage/methylation domain-containing protein